jgi:hypothetical protein
MDEVQKYYPRIQAVRDALITAFPEAEKALVEKIADDWYASEFEGKENSDGDEEV